MPYARCARVSFIHSIVALITSMSRSTCVKKCCVCWWRVSCSGLVPGPVPELELKPWTFADAFLPFFDERDLDPLSSFNSYGIT